MRHSRTALAASILLISMAGCERAAKTLPCGVLADRAARSRWIGRWVEALVVIGSPEGMECHTTRQMESHCYVPASCADSSQKLYVLLDDRHLRTWYDEAGWTRYPNMEITTDESQHLVQGDFVTVRGLVASDSTQEFFVDGTVKGAEVHAIPSDPQAEAAVAAFEADLGTFRAGIAKLFEAPKSCKSALEAAERSLEAHKAGFRATYASLRMLAPPRIRQATLMRLFNSTQEEQLNFIISAVSERLSGPEVEPGRERYEDLFPRIKRLQKAYAQVFADVR